MTEARQMQLHLGKCIEDLEDMHNVPDLKSKKVQMLCNTAQKLLHKAEQAREKGDEEYSYVYYMRYLRVVSYISKDQDYQRDKKYYTDMIGLKNPNRAMDAAEKLKSSLIERYERQQKTKCINEIKELERTKQKVEENRKKVMEVTPLNNDVSLSITLPGPDEVTINADVLYAILKCGKLKLMILDTRPNSDFEQSHINHPSCISVPEEVINPGQSANVLEQNLPAASKPVWAERASMQLIVMLDWNSQTLIPGKAMYLLKTILLKWDVKVQYSRTPLALLGGYEEWLLRYPALATGPCPRRTEHQDIAHLLEEIEYPSWSDLSSGSPSGQSALSSQPVVAGSPAAVGMPVVDRASKAAAVQVYEERSRNMQMILDQQERIADTSLNLEMQRIEAEQDWEDVRQRRETAERSELEAMYQLREHEIISQLLQLENKQYDIEQENQTLRKRLEEYQRREREDAIRLADTVADTPPPDRQTEEKQRLTTSSEVAAKLARIHAVEERKDELDRKRKRLEALRKRKLAEARGKKKPTIDKDDDGDTYMVSPSDAIGRSQSSPNIAKISSDEDEPSPPMFDRNTKPTPRVAPSSDVHKQRDFQPVWGDVSRGLTGLKNLGNTCYMNSIIQCLNNTAILVSYFCSGQYLEHINRSHATRGQIAEELAAVIRALWSGQYKFIAAKDFRNEVGKHQRAFRGCEQQDSHEFLTILMDWLHDDLQVSVTPQPKENLSAMERAWRAYSACKESLVLRVFYGQIVSTVRCLQPRCASRSATHEPFSNLSLELPPHAARCTLADCLRLYLNGETIPGWNCPQCKEKRDAVKKLDISRLPPVLVIHFKRFYLDPKEFMCNSYRKKQTYIDFPLEDLDMRQFALNCNSNPIYNLYAVSNHYGSMEGGHYTAYCKNSAYGKWYKYDDHVVTEIPSSEVKSSAAYILFYTSRSVT